LTRSFGKTEIGALIAGRVKKSVLANPAMANFVLSFIVFSLRWLRLMCGRLFPAACRIIRLKLVGDLSRRDDKTAASILVVCGLDTTLFCRTSQFTKRNYCDEA
jgi:hypothetical protein